MGGVFCFVSVWLGVLFVCFIYTHAHFVYGLLKARPEITFDLISSKTIWVDKPEHGLEGNEITGLIQRDV